MKHFSGIMMLLLCFAQQIAAETIYDAARERHIPVAISFPDDVSQCSAETQCAVAFLSAGYGVPHLHYQFLTAELNQLGYLVVAIGHELPTDPPLAVSGNLYQRRSENWQRGADSLDFVQATLRHSLKNYDFTRLTLIGHSNGGDISAWLANTDKAYIDSIITLDHRRVPLPRDNNIKVLSIRGSDFPADSGVLPTAAEQQQYGSCVLTLADARHNDMTDKGPAWLKQQIRHVLRQHLAGQPCPDA